MFSRSAAEEGDLPVDHKAKDAQHGDTAIVVFDGTLGELCLPIKVVQANVNVAVTEFAYGLVDGSFNIAPEM